MNIRKSQECDKCAFKDFALMKHVMTKHKMWETKQKIWTKKLKVIKNNTFFTLDNFFGAIGFGGDKGCSCRCLVEVVLVDVVVRLVVLYHAIFILYINVKMLISYQV